MTTPLLLILLWFSLCVSALVVWKAWRHESNVPKSSFVQWGYHLYKYVSEGGVLDIGRLVTTSVAECTQHEHVEDEGADLSLGMYRSKQFHNLITHNYELLAKTNECITLTDAVHLARSLMGFSFLEFLDQEWSEYENAEDDVDFTNQFRKRVRSGTDFITLDLFRDGFQHILEEVANRRKRKWEDTWVDMVSNESASVSVDQAVIYFCKANNIETKEVHELVAKEAAVLRKQVNGVVTLKSFIHFSSRVYYRLAYVELPFMLSAH